MAYFFLILTHMDLIESIQNSSTSKICDFHSIRKDLLDWLEMGNVLVSFVSMTLTSIVTVGFIFKSRRRLKSLPKIQALKSQIRDVKFAVTSISLNVFFLLTNAPIPIYSLYDTYFELNERENGLKYFIETLVVFLWYFYYACNFYLQLIVNSLVRAEFFMLLSWKDTASQTSTTMR